MEMQIQWKVSYFSYFCLNLFRHVRNLVGAFIFYIFLILFFYAEQNVCSFIVTRLNVIQHFQDFVPLTQYTCLLMMFMLLTL